VDAYSNGRDRPSICGQEAATPPLDHRTRGGKRVREVTRILTEALGGNLSKVKVGHAALLVAVSEIHRTSGLKERA
jgi:hypothetical protein